MRYVATPLNQVWIVEIEPVEDDRGFFARTWCTREFAEHGLNPQLLQCNLSWNRRKGTVRGMHFQRPPHEEAKLVRCTRGAIYDVVVDLRPASPSFRAWFALELSAAGRQLVYVPEGCAHGFQTLEDDCEVFYQMTAVHVPAAADGVRWNDPAFGVRWPLPVTLISDKDAGYVDFDRARVR